jgi:hypothetical protein
MLSVCGDYEATQVILLLVLAIAMRHYGYGKL